jgi:hypothetical protein
VGISTLRSFSTAREKLLLGNRLEVTTIVHSSSWKL